MVPNADWDAIQARLREEYAEDIVQEMLVKLWSAKATIEDPIRYAKSCLRDIHAQRGREIARKIKHEVQLVDRLAVGSGNPLARAIARQELERTPAILVADELGLRVQTQNSTSRVQRHRARRKVKP